MVFFTFGGDVGFQCFLEDMGERPSPIHSLDRRDNNLGYSPDNCRWATKQQQAHNRITNKRYEFRGQMLTIPEIAALTGTSKETLRSRLSRAKSRTWTVEEAIAEPPAPWTQR